ncbi:hypothetical protein [Faecalicoccus pleomorphus]|uniref:hypothetical protein n=1 Tax=Faecalicoccus pleomorphus TaxID=1323 RepID=UPI00195FDDB7|nr:hypothetical protein [Faecalicoccus pleomorphus]MBM6808230.1 hypothetical protein [Faecalicoccus pleomorphus]
MNGREQFRSIFKKKGIEPDAYTNLEKGDRMALMIAALSVFGPILLMGIGILALFIWGWNAFF